VEFTCVAISGNSDVVGIVNSWGITGTGGATGFIGGASGSAQEMGWGFFSGTGHIVKNNSSQSAVNTATWGAGDVIGVAIDLDNKRIWWRLNTGSWIGTTGTPDPATNTNGFNISLTATSSTRVYPAVNLSGSSAKFTANFGASAFTGTVPSGFTAGWTNTVSTSIYFGSLACSGRMTATSGFSAPPINDKQVSPWISSFTGTLDHVIFAWPTPITDMKGVIYDATGTSGLPGALLGVSTNTITIGAKGENSFSFSGVSLTSGTTYWIGFVSDTTPSNGNNSMFAEPQTTGVAFNTGPYSSPSNPFGASPSTGNERFAMLAFQTVTNTNVNATGTSASGSAGTLTPEVDISASGTSGAGAANATIANVGANPSGVSGTGAVNPVTVTYPGTAQVSGVSASGAAGTTTETFDFTVSAVGIAANGAANPVTLVYDSNVSVTGVSASALAAAVLPVAVSPTLLLPVFSIMRDVPVAANGNMSDTPVPAIGTMTNVLPIVSLMRNTTVASTGSMSTTPVAVTGSLFAA
jgi:hypothetical protein